MNILKIVGHENQLDADYSIVMDDESMEPYIKRGEILYLMRGEMPEAMQVGAFLYKGKILCRQWCEDYSGSIHLLCANASYSDFNICISAEMREECLCLGKVQTREKLPLPVY